MVILIIFWLFLWSNLPTEMDLFYVVAHHTIPQAVLIVDFMLNQVQVNLKMSLFIILYVLIYFLYAVYYTLTDGPIYPMADLKSLETSLLYPITSFMFISIFYFFSLLTFLKA